MMAEVTDDFPEKFYRYRSMDGDKSKWVERTVLHDEIYFPPASSFNDPFDLRPAFSLQATPEQHREDFLRMSRKFEPNLTDEQRDAETNNVMTTSLSGENIKNTAQYIQMIHNHLITKAVGVLCVSTKSDDILMWSHYADSHRGICLEFDGKLPFMAHAQKIHYAHERFPINPYNDSHEVMMEKALLTKSEHWTYEAEWRLCRYNGGPGVVQFRSINLTGIIIGALASSETVNTIKNWAEQRPLPINVYRASVSPQKFKLDITSMK